MTKITYREWEDTEEAYWLRQRFNLDVSKDGLMLHALFDNINKVAAQIGYAQGFAEGYEDGHAKSVAFSDTQ